MNIRYGEQGTPFDASVANMVIGDLRQQLAGRDLASSLFALEEYRHTKIYHQALRKYAQGKGSANEPYITARAAGARNNGPTLEITGMLSNALMRVPGLQEGGSC